jgi:tRNA pseudouridine-54 N-methylase
MIELTAKEEKWAEAVSKAIASTAYDSAHWKSLKDIIRTATGIYRSSNEEESILDNNTLRRVVLYLTQKGNKIRFEKGVIHAGV